MPRSDLVFTEEFKAFLSIVGDDTDMNSFADKVYDSLFDFDDIVEADKQQFDSIVDASTTNGKFIEALKSVFVPGMYTGKLRRIMNDSEIRADIPFSTAKRIVKDIFNLSTNSTVKDFIYYLMFPIELAFFEAAGKYHALDMPGEAFGLFFLGNIKSGPKTITDHNSYCLLRHLINEDLTDELEAVPASPMCANIRMDFTVYDSFPAIWSALYKSAIALNEPKRSGGFNIDDKFENAVKLLGRLSNGEWNKMAAASSMDSTPSAEQSSTTLNDSEIIDIYGKNIYELVPGSEPMSADLDAYGLVSDVSKFSRFGYDRQKQIMHFLKANRVRLNKILISAGKIIQKRLIDASRFDPNTESISAVVKNAFTAIIGKFKAADTSSVSKTISFIVNEYIPMLYQLKSKMMLKDVDMGSLMSHEHLVIVAVAGMLDEGGKPIAQQGGSIESKPEVKPAPVNRQVGGSAYTELLDSIAKSQRDFNQQFELIYRKLSVAISNVSINVNQLDTDERNSLYSLLNALRSLSITNPNTSYYMSGFYGKKNYNASVRRIVVDTANYIDMKHIKGFDEVKSSLNAWASLLESSGKQVEDYRNKLLLVPKSSAEMMILGKAKVKIPCKLTEKDIIFMHDAIGRLFANLRNSANEVNLASAKGQVEEYIKNASNHEKQIEEHYNFLTQSRLSEFVGVAYDQYNGEAKKAISAINRQLCEAMKYMNSTVDVALSKQRIEDLKNISVTSEQIERINNAFMAFRGIKPGEDFKREVEKLKKYISGTHIGNIYKLHKHLRKLYLYSQYINFIKQLCRELGLMKDFNWDEFEKFYTIIISFSQYIVLPQITTGSSTPPFTPFALAEALASDKDTYDAIIALFDCPENRKGTPFVNKSNHKAAITDKKLTIINGNDSTGVEIAADAVKGYKPIAGTKLYAGTKYNADTTLSPAGTFCIGLNNNDTPEATICLHTIDAFVANVIAVIDKYWSVRYDGNLSIPTGIGNILRGGDKKKEGGSIFDVAPLHDTLEGSVIPEAVPFYICAINTIGYHESRKETGSEARLMLKIGEMSILYPIHEIFNKYKASVDSLTPNQLKTILAVLNKIWNESSGSAASKLARAIDIFFGELNSCFIFTDEMHAELAKASKNISDTMIDAVYSNVSGLIDSMSTAISESVVESASDPVTENKEFERFLHNAYVKVLKVPEQQRIAELKSILLNKHSVDSLSEYYKFMELVICPMLVASKAYGQLFALFDSYKVEFAEGNNSVEVDLDKVTKVDNADDLRTCINKVKNGEDMTAKYTILTYYNHVVLKWNKLLLRRAIDEMHQTNSFRLPKFWIPMDEATYPTVTKLEYSPVNAVNKNDNIFIMRQLWPAVKAATVADYFNVCVQEFQADYDHLIHNFFSYPGLSDRSIKAISDAAHAKFDVEDKDGVLQINYKGVAYASDHLKSIPVKESGVYMYPPAYASGEFIPRLNDGSTVALSMEITRGGTGFVIDGIGQTIATATNSGNQKPYYGSCFYNWFDWVVYSVARCDRTNYCLPYKFIMMLQNFPSFAPYMRLPEISKDKTYMIYNRGTATSFYNVITQNLIYRSVGNSNKERYEYSSLNGAWIAAIVASTPYIINVLTAAMKNTSPSVTYNGNNVKQLLSDLIDVTTSFYADISIYAPRLEFMSDAVQLTGRPHAFAELVQFVETPRDHTPSDFVKIEWANMYFFNSLGLTFPVYRDFDKFSSIKEYAGDKIVGQFASEFDSTVQLMGRLAWVSVIAKPNDVNYFGEFQGLDDLIISIINVMCECDDIFIQQVIDNVLRAYNGGLGGMTGRGLSGGSLDNPYDFVIVDDTYGLADGFRQAPSRIDHKLFLESKFGKELEIGKLQKCPVFSAVSSDNCPGLLVMVKAVTGNDKLTKVTFGTDVAGDATGDNDYKRKITGISGNVITIDMVRKWCGNATGNSEVGATAYSGQYTGALTGKVTSGSLTVTNGKWKLENGELPFKPTGDVNANGDYTVTEDTDITLNADIRITLTREVKPDDKITLENGSKITLKEGSKIILKKDDKITLEKDDADVYYVKLNSPFTISQLYISNGSDHELQLKCDGITIENGKITVDKASITVDTPESLPTMITRAIITAQPERTGAALTPICPNVHPALLRFIDGYIGKDGKQGWDWRPWDALIDMRSVLATHVYGDITEELGDKAIRNSLIIAAELMAQMKHMSPSHNNEILWSLVTNALNNTYTGTALTDLAVQKHILNNTIAWIYCHGNNDLFYGHVVRNVNAVTDFATQLSNQPAAFNVYLCINQPSGGKIADKDSLQKQAGILAGKMKLLSRGKMVGAGFTGGASFVPMQLGILNRADDAIAVALGAAVNIKARAHYQAANDITIGDYTWLYNPNQFSGTTQGLSTRDYAIAVASSSQAYILDCDLPFRADTKQLTIDANDAANTDGTEIPSCDLHAARDIYIEQSCPSHRIGLANIPGDDMATNYLKRFLYSPRKSIYEATLAFNPTYHLIEAANLNEEFANTKIKRGCYTGVMASIMPTVGTVKSTPLSVYLNKLTDGIVGDKEIKEVNNYGFYGSVGGGLFGGAVEPIRSPLTARFISNPYGITGTTTSALMASAYTTEDKVATDGQLLFKRLFHDISDSRPSMDSRRIYAYTLGYFKKFNISFSSMFSGVTYPSILLGAAALKQSANQFKAITNAIHVDGTNNGLVLRFAKAYFDALVKDGKVEFGSSVNDVSKLFSEHKENIRGDGTTMTALLANGAKIELGDIAKSPSVANAYLNGVLNTKSIPLLYSQWFKNICRTDGVMTFLNVVIMLMRQTSYYNAELDGDITYFKSANPEIFSTH